MPSSLLPSLTRLTLQSDPIVPTAAPTDSTPRDSFYFDIMGTRSVEEKMEVLVKLQERVGHASFIVQRFVDSSGIVAMVELLSTSEMAIKISAAHVLHTLLDVQCARDSFVDLGGVPILVGMLHELAGHDRKQALVPFLDLVQVLVGHDSSRERLQTQKAVEALASVVREAGLRDTPNNDHEGAHALRLIVTLVFDSWYIVQDSYEIDLSVLIVDGAWLARPAPDPTRQRAMEALQNLTESNGAHMDAVRQALVAEGALPVLLGAIGADARAFLATQSPPEPFPLLVTSLQYPLERVAWVALRQLNAGNNPEWRVLVDELNVLILQRDSLTAHLEEMIESGDWTGMMRWPLLTREAAHLAATHPQWFMLIGWIDIVALVLTTPNAMLRLTAKDTTAMVVALKQCLNVVNIWRQIYAYTNLATLQLTHPFGENPRYTALVPVLMPMLHEDASVNRRRAAARCLEKLSNAGWSSSLAMRTEDVIGNLLAFLTPTLTAAALSGEKSVHSVLTALGNLIHADGEPMDRFVDLGGPAVINKYLTSTSPRILKRAVFLVKTTAESEAEVYRLEDYEVDEDLVERNRVDDVQSLVALLRPGRVDDTDTRLDILGSLEALVLPDLPEQTDTRSLSDAQYGTLTSAFDAMVGASGIEVLIPLMRVNMEDESDASHWMAVRLIRKAMLMHVPFIGASPTVNVAVRFAVAGGIAALVDAGQWQDGNTDPRYAERMQIHLSETFKLEKFLRALTSRLPDWIPMLLDVTNAVALKQPSEQDREAKDCHEALPEARWGSPKQLALAVRSYGQIYDLLSQYRARRASEPDFEEVLRNCPVFAAMDDQKILLKAARAGTRATTKQGKDIVVQNHKPSLLAAELWIVHAISDVLLTNVSVPPVEDGARLTVAQNRQVTQYRKLLGEAQLLQAQYAWAVAHPNPLAHFVEAIRTEIRLHELLTLLVEKIEAPMHANGRRTVTLRYELERFDEDEVVPDAEKRKLYGEWDNEWEKEEESRPSRMQRTSAALRASVATLYGAEQTDATMTRLFQHLQRAKVQ